MNSQKLRQLDYVEHMLEAIRLVKVWETVEQSLPLLERELLSIQNPK